MSPRSDPHLSASRRHGSVGAFALCALFAWTSTNAFAQQGQPATAPAVETSSPEHIEPPDPEEMIERSNKSLTRMRRALKIVLSKLEEARETKDVIKLNCVNDRLTDVKSMLRISEQADVSLQEALARHDHSKAIHALGTVEANGRKIDQLATESDQCIGLFAFDTAGTTLTVQEPEDDYWEDELDAAKGAPHEMALEGATHRPLVASPVE